MSQPITWQNINTPNFGSAAALVKSGGDTLTRAAEQLAQQAQGVRQQNIANADTLSRENTESVLGEIAGLKNLTDLATAEQDGRFSQGTLNAASGGNIDQRAIRTALAGQDDVIRKEETDLYNYARVMDSQNDDPLNRDFGADVLNANNIGELSQVRDAVNASDLIDRNPIIGQINNRIQGFKDAEAAAKQQSFSNGIQSARLALQSRGAARQDKLDRQNDTLNQTLLNAINTQQDNVQKQQTALSQLDAEYSDVLSAKPAELLNNEAYSTDIANVMTDLRAKNPNLGEGEIQAQAVAQFQNNKQAELETRIRETNFIKSNQDWQADFVQVAQENNIPVGQLMQAQKVFESSTAGYFELSEDQQKQVVAGMINEQNDYKSTIIALDEAYKIEEQTRPISLVLAPGEEKLTQEGVLGNIFKDMPEEGFLSKVYNANVFAQATGIKADTFQSVREDLNSFVTSGYKDPRNPESDRPIKIPAGVLKRAQQANLVQGRGFDVGGFKATVDALMPEYLQSEANRKALVLERQRRDEGKVQAQMHLMRLQENQIKAAKRASGKVDLPASSQFNRVINR